MLIGAGDVAAAGRAAWRFARDGADVMLLHRPSDEAAALSIALRVEAEGRRCELLAGDLDDGALCEEAAIHAAFLGQGGIGAVVYAGTPPPSAPDGREPWSGRPSSSLAAAECWSLVRAALPHLVGGARVLHPWPPSRAGQEDEAPAGRRGLLEMLRREHGIEGSFAVFEGGPGAPCGTGLGGGNQRAPEAFTS